MTDPWQEFRIRDEMPPQEWLLQGDMLDGIRIPMFDKLEFHESYQEIPVEEGTLVVMTQSCDLANRKAPMVACCPVHSLVDFETFNERFKRKGE